MRHPISSPYSALFLCALIFLMLARRGVHMAVSALLASLFTVLTAYGLLLLHEADQQDTDLAAMLSPARWTPQSRQTLKNILLTATTALCVLLGAGLLAGHMALFPPNTEALTPGW